MKTDNRNGRPIRVLCVFMSLDRGGAESMCMSLYRNIDRRNIQFDFVKHKEKKCDFEDEIVEMGGRIYEAPEYKGYNIIQYQNWWRAFFENHPECIIVHGHAYTIADLYLSIAQKYGRITVAHSHCTSVSGRGLLQTYKRLLAKRAGYHADYCIACSSEAGKWLFKGKSFSVLNNAINTSEFAYNATKREAIRKKYAIENRIVIGHIGSFTKQKNHFFLLEVFAKLKGQLPNAILLLIGGGKEKENIESRAIELGVFDSIVFTGVQRNVSELLSAMDIFVLPSLYEGLPVVAVEAQANGLTCFLSDVITREVELLPTCKYLPNDNSDVWVREILGTDMSRHQGASQIVAERGFDVKKTSDWIQEFYQTISKCMREGNL